MSRFMSKVDQRRNWVKLKSVQTLLRIACLANRKSYVTMDKSVLEKLRCLLAGGAKNILIVAIWKSRQAFWAYGWGNMPLQADKLVISHNNVVGENTVLQLNILETGVLTLVVQNSSPIRLFLVGDKFWPTRVRTPVSKMFLWRTYNS